jgi:hypothetical protein
MTHWGWYWKIKKKHTPKELCSWSQFCELDSFDMFKRQELVKLVKESKDRICLQIPKYNLVAILQDNDFFTVTYNNGSYTIPTEKKPCNFGGNYYFFHCPQCNSRMRKLYCVDGKYLCRKCAKLGYYSQRLRPSERFARQSYKVKEHLKNYAGSLEIKPPRMKHHTFQRLRSRFVKYDEMQFNAECAEFRLWHGAKMDLLLGDPYRLLMPSNLYDAYVEL